MRLLRLQVRNLRNLASLELELGPGATVIVGPNGQGKTNLLESVYFLATLKPLRASRLEELIRFGETVTRVEGRFELGGAERTIAVEVERGERRALVDGKSAAHLDDYFGGVSVVAFTPDDLALVKGGPDLRRRFMDRAVFNRFPAYLEESRTYARALRNRNRLVRDRGPAEVIASFDGPLARSGARLWSRRRTLLEELEPRARRFFADVSGLTTTAALALTHRAAGVGDLGSQSEPELEALLADALQSRLPRDLERGFTSAGPHADDLGIALHGHLARAYASQGQQRAIVLALKLGEIENLAAVLGRPPLLLLDDVSSELDPEKNAFLMQALRDRPGQVLLTTTDVRLVLPGTGADAAIFDIRAGVLTPHVPAIIDRSGEAG